MKLTIKDFRILENNNFVKELNETQLENLKKELELLKTKSYKIGSFTYEKVYKHPKTNQIIIGSYNIFEEQMKQIFIEQSSISKDFIEYIDWEVVEEKWSYEYVENFVKFDCTLIPE